MILFVDYDAVLHGGEVYLAGKTPFLRADGVLFEHAPLLVKALDGREDVQLVLSTSWVPHLGFDRAKSFLPLALQRKVIGATYHRHAGLHRREWLMLTRYYQISTYVNRHGLRDWLAIDDDDAGWPADLRDHLVHCHDGEKGLAAEGVFEQLRIALGKAVAHRPTV